jgi:hypothetical protein
MSLILSRRFLPFYALIPEVSEGVRIQHQVEACAACLPSVQSEVITESARQQEGSTRQQPVTRGQHKSRTRKRAFVDDEASEEGAGSGDETSEDESLNAGSCEFTEKRDMTRVLEWKTINPNL